MLPATQHLPGHGVEIVTPMLPTIIVVILAREYTTPGRGLTYSEEENKSCQAFLFS